MEYQKVAEHYHEQLMNLARMTGYTTANLKLCVDMLEQVIKWYRLQESDGWNKELKDVIHRLDDINGKMNEVWNKREEHNSAIDILNGKKINVG